MEKKDGKTTKEKIINAMMELVATEGYQGASMRKIARQVGIRESAIYNHFRNKEAIFEEILKELFSSAFDDFFDRRPMEEAALRGKRFLKEFAMAYKLVAFDPKHEKLFRIILIEMMRNQKVRELFLNHFYDQNIKRLSSAFFVMMQNDLVRSEDPRIMAYEFLAPLFWMRLQISLLRLDGKSTTPLSTIFERHVDFFWQGISLAKEEP
jgi:AcrR family transcriptional regulator